jgi:hypothetical protein
MLVTLFKLASYRNALAQSWKSLERPVCAEADFASDCTVQHKEDDTIQGARIANLN